MIAIIISIISLLLSLVIFYNSNVRIVRDLYVIPVYAGGVLPTSNNTIKDYSNNLRFRLVVVNNGNRSEAILSVSVGYTLGDLSRIDTGGPASFVMEPGDIKIIDVSEDMDSFMTNLSASKMEWSVLGVAITAVMPDGSVDRQFRQFAKIRNGAAEDATSRHIQVVLDKDQLRLNIIRSDSLRSWVEYLDYF